MKKIKILILLFIMFFTINVEAIEFNLNSNHAILYNLNDGKYKDDESFSWLDVIRYDFKNLNDEIKIIEELEEPELSEGNGFPYWNRIVTTNVVSCGFW